MSSCAELEPLLGAFEDGELKPHVMRDVALHVAGCSHCSAITGDYAIVAQQLREAAVEPAMEGFTAQVMTRVACMQPAWYVRLGRRLAASGEQASAWLSLTSMAIAVAALTVIIATPYVQHLAGRTAAVQVASNSQKPVVQAQAKTSQQIAALPASSAGAMPVVANQPDAEAQISRLDVDNPAVALWSAPGSNTTVIWVPDQH